MLAAARWLGSLLPVLATLASAGPCVRIRPATPPAPEVFVEPAAALDTPTSELVLPSGYCLRVCDGFTQRSRMWADAALMFADYRDLWVLDGSASALRRVYYNPENYGLCLGIGRRVSADRRSVLAWFDPLSQLVRMDLASGHISRLTQMPTRITSLEFRQYFDPMPVPREAGVVEDPPNRRLLFVVQQADNSHVAPWSRNETRNGGYAIAAADPNTRNVTRLSGSRLLPGTVRAWDISARRGHAYLLVLQAGRTSLMIRQLDGQLVRELEIPELSETSERIALSPDENTLLVERIDHRRLPDGRAEGSPDSGFVLLDLDFLEIRPGPASGFLCTWSPDGSSIAYLDGRELLLWDVKSGRSELLASREPTAPASAGSYNDAPCWSDDGRRLAVEMGGTDVNVSDFTTVAFDLDAREFLVMDGEAPHAGLVWLPVPHPFPAP